MITLPSSGYYPLISKVSHLTAVPSQQLTVFNLPPARTVFVSDFKTVFAKHLAEEGDRELFGVQYAQAHEIPTPRLLAHGVLERRLVLCFEHMKLDDAAPTNPLPLLQQLWSLPGSGRESITGFSDRRERAFNNLAFVDSGEPLKAAVVNLLEDFVEEEKKLEKRIAAAKTTWIHGDFHRRNTGFSGGLPVVFDFEWHSRGYREFDVGKWLQTELTETEDPNPWPFWEAVRTTDLDLELVKLEARQSAARALSYQLRWKTRLDWIEDLWELASGGGDFHRAL